METENIGENHIYINLFIYSLLSLKLIKSRPKICKKNFFNLPLCAEHEETCEY